MTREELIKTCRGIYRETLETAVAAATEKATDKATSRVAALIVKYRKEAGDTSSLRALCQDINPDNWNSIRNTVQRLENVATQRQKASSGGVKTGNKSRDSRYPWTCRSGNHVIRSSEDEVKRYDNYPGQCKKCRQATAKRNTDKTKTKKKADRNGHFTKPSTIAAEFRAEIRDSISRLRFFAKRFPEFTKDEDRKAVAEVILECAEILGQLHHELMLGSEAHRLLGVTAQSSQEEIRRKYREFARIYHPDMGGDPTNFDTITKAYKSLI